MVMTLVTGIVREVRTRVLELVVAPLLVEVSAEAVGCEAPALEEYLAKRITRSSLLLMCIDTRRLKPHG